MKVLISSIGSRGDVQPILVLAREIESLGHRARLCVAPNFNEWVGSFGIECVPIGPDLERLAAGMTTRQQANSSTETVRRIATLGVRSQFPVLLEAARGCDLVVAAGALQFAARSVAEFLKLPYVFATYCAAVLPSPDHPPPKMGAHHSHLLSRSENVSLWEAEERSWNELFRDSLNDERAKLALDPVDSVHRHTLTDRPWLAADPILGPAGEPHDIQIVQTGAWLPNDPRRLPDPVEDFLSSGPPPVYFGFGSMRAAEDTSRIVVESARALGLRSLISRGWGNLQLIDDGSDCLLLEDVAHQSLFPRVAAIVHHGGAGTTTIAARAGVPQVVVPHLYDQYYWAHRVQQLGIGVAGSARDGLNVDRIVAALQKCNDPEISVAARSLSLRIEDHGAEVAAERLIKDYA
ncbi:MAG: glycosyltransferase [Steroidobacteraceae bacterium]